MSNASTETAVVVVISITGRPDQHLRLPVEPDVVLSGGRWLPGVVRDASDPLMESMLAEMIAYGINEGPAAQGEITADIAHCLTDPNWQDDPQWEEVDPDAVVGSWKILTGAEHLPQFRG